ncbi:hypothetical protein D3C78_1646700 [compost metagenome]
MMDRAPAIMTMMAMTQANIGRLIKKLDMPWRPLTVIDVRQGLSGVRRLFRCPYLHARLQAHQAADDHFIAGLQPRRHQPFVANRLAGDHLT